jgi:hypothetical protein
MKKIILFLFVLLLLALVYSFYKEVTTTKNPKRIACQEKTTTFEKINSNAPIKEAIELLKTQQYIIKSHIEYSTYMPSYLINILNIQEANELLEEVISSHTTQTANSAHALLIDYYIYENDKEDKGKKNAQAKKYAGYVVFEFKLNNQLIYKIQTDYMDIDAKDLKERFSCVIESFISLEK